MTPMVNIIEINKIINTLYSPIATNNKVVERKKERVTNLINSKHINV